MNSSRAKGLSRKIAHNYCTFHTLTAFQRNSWSLKNITGEPDFNSGKTNIFRNIMSLTSAGTTLKKARIWGGTRRHKTKSKPKIKQTQFKLHQVIKLMKIRVGEKFQLMAGVKEENSIWLLVSLWGSPTKPFLSPASTLHHRFRIS